MREGGPALARQHQRDHGAGLAGPRGAAGPVQVVLRVLGRVDVHDERDAVDVDAAGGDVGRDQHVDPALAELGQRARAHPLGLAAVQGAGPDADLGELLDQPVDRQLGPHEHDGAAGPGRDRGERRRTCRAAGPAARGASMVSTVAVAGVGLVGHRVVQEAADQRVDVTVERGREQQPLAAARASAPAAR